MCRLWCVQRCVTGVIAPMLVALIVVAPAAATAQAKREIPPPPAAAMKDFQARLTAYLKLREELARRLEPLSPTASSADLSARQESLAAGLRTARKDARQGDLIPMPVATYVAAVVLDDFRSRPAPARKAELEEVPIRVRPVVNRTYPPNAALPTVPPLLLKRLPTLPDNLQYRFFGRHVVILDGDTQIITDYIVDVLPPL